MYLVLKCATSLGVPVNRNLPKEYFPPIDIRHDLLKLKSLLQLIGHLLDWLYCEKTLYLYYILGRLWLQGSGRPLCGTLMPKFLQSYLNIICKTLRGNH